jgi:hypothetical protein
MKAGKPFEFLPVCRMVRKYQGQLVLSVDTESTPVPLARMDEFLRLSEHPFLPMTE